MTWDTSDINDNEIIQQDGVFAYLFTASGTIYAGQAVKLIADNTVAVTSSGDDGIGIAAIKTYHGDQIGVFGPGNIVTTAVAGSYPVGTALYAGDNGIMVSSQSSSERIMGYVVKTGVKSSTNYKTSILLV